MAEDYVRPPIVAAEAPSRRAAIWRFRIYVIIAVAAFVVGFILIFLAITGSNNDNGGVVGTLAPTNHFFAGSDLA